MSQSQQQMQKTERRSKQTATEAHTALIRMKIKEFVSDYYNVAIADTEMNFVLEDPPFEIWTADLERGRRELHSAGEKPTKIPKEIYLLWDEKEIRSTEELDQIMTDYVALSQRRREKEKWDFYRSPIIVSGIIGLALVLTTCVLALTGRAVPSELWSLLTAVVAFYFGGEVSQRSKRADGN